MVVAYRLLLKNTKAVRLLTWFFYSPIYRTRPIEGIQYQPAALADSRKNPDPAWLPGWKNRPDVPLIKEKVGLEKQKLSFKRPAPPQARRASRSWARIRAPLAVAVLASGPDASCQVRCRLPGSRAGQSLICLYTF